MFSKKRRRNASFLNKKILVFNIRFLITYNRHKEILCGGDSKTSDSDSS